MNFHIDPCGGDTAETMAWDDERLDTLQWSLAWVWLSWNAETGRIGIC